MTHRFIFVDRRKQADRRILRDPCKGLPVDLYHRKRRKSQDRREANKTLTEDYYSFLKANLKSKSVDTRSTSRKPVN